MSKAWERGSDTRWRRLRASVLQLHLPPSRRPACALAMPGRCTGVATQVDHIVPLHAGGDRYDRNNLRPVCAPCNTGRGSSDGRPEPPYSTVSSW